MRFIRDILEVLAIALAASKYARTGDVRGARQAMLRA